MRRRQATDPPQVAWLSIKQIAAKYDRLYDTVWEWITRGVNGVKLKARMIGGRWAVEPAHLEEFFTALEEKSARQPDVDDEDAPPIRRERRRPISEEGRKAIERLKKRGLM